MTTFNRIKNIIVNDMEFNNPDKVTPEANLTEDVGLDSLDVVDMIMAIEETFKIEVPDRDVGQLKTVQDVVNYVEARQV